MGVVRLQDALAVTCLCLLMAVPHGFTPLSTTTAKDSGDCENRGDTETGEDGRTRITGCRRTHSNTINAFPTNNDTLNDSLRLFLDAYSRHVGRIRDKERRRFLIMNNVWRRRFIPNYEGSDSVRVEDVNDFNDFEALVQHDQDTNSADEDQAIIYSPQCSGPRNFSVPWNDRSNFRLFFNVEGSESTNGDEELSSAFLYIKRKPAPSTTRLTTQSSRNGRQGGGGGGGGGSSGGRGGNKRRPKQTINANNSGSTEENGDKLKVVIYTYTQLSKTRRRQETKSVIRTIVINRNSPGWLRVNLTSIVDDWMKRPAKNLGLQVVVHQREGTTDESNPADYFEGTSCTEDYGQLTQPMIWMAEDELPDTVSDMLVDNLDTNITHPFLEVVTIDGSRSSPRQQQSETDDRNQHSRK